MTNEVNADKNGTITARTSGTPAEDGNRNNFIGFSVNPKTHRVGIEGGMGATGEYSPSDNLTIIGTTGATLRISGNTGISADQATRQHNARTDTPLPSHAMGIFEARDVLNQIMRETNGDLGKYTLGQAHAIIEQRPNLVKPATREHLNQLVTTLNNTNYTPPPELAEARGAIDALHQRWVETGKPQVQFSHVDSALRLTAPQLQLSSDAKALTQSFLTQANGNIEQAYQTSKTLPPELFSPQNAGERILPLTLTEINHAAARTQAYITTHGGVNGTSKEIVQTANQYLLSTGQPPLPSSSTNEIKGGVTEIANNAALIQQQYKKLPSVEELAHRHKQINRLVEIDPRIESASFVGLGVLTPHASGALIAEKAVTVGIGNLDRVAGEGIRIHPATTRTVRGELGIGDESQRFSPDTAIKLNLAPSRTDTQTGGYLFAEREQTSWQGIEGSRSTQSLGMGIGVSQPLGNNTTGFLAAEAQTSRTEGHGLENMPTPKRDKKITVKGGVVF